MHVVWNAFETCMKLTARWEYQASLLTATLSLLGHTGLRDRFLEKCLPQAPREQRALFHDWPYTTIDWKWEYMEKVFCRLSQCIDLLLEVF